MRNIWVILDEAWQTPIEVSYVGHDSFTNKVYLISSDGDLYSFDTGSETFTLESSLEIPPDDEILSLEMVQEIEHICAITRSGEIVTDEEVIGSITGGILAASWSPSQDYLALISAEGKLILMNAQFEPILEIPANDDPNDPIPSAGSLSWRGDSKFVQVSLALGEKFKAITYSSRGEIERSPSQPDENIIRSVSVAPNTEQTHHLVAWQPSGYLVAGIGNGNVIFWEKNGLRHGECAISESYTGCLWSPDSEILTVYNEKSVKLYIRSNYKWYLKTEIAYENLVQVKWLDDSSILLVGSNEIRIAKIQWRYDGVASAWVVDGSRLTCSELYRTTIPPPLFNYAVDLDAQPACLHCTRSMVFVGVGDNVVAIADKAQKFRIPFDGPRHVAAVGSKLLVIGKTEGTIYTISTDGYEAGATVDLSTYNPIISATTCEENFVLQDKSGQVLTVNLLGAVSPAVKLSKPSPKFAQSTDGRVFSLFKTQLFIDNTLFSSDITDFSITPDRIFLVRRGSPLYSLHIFKTNEQIKLVESTSELFSVRNIERESRIVTSADIRVFLQMPRGNLETVFPRILTIDAIVEHINSQEYLAAFNLLKTHRIDLNFIVDIDVAEFLNHVDLFITQIEKQDAIDLFLTALHESDSSSKYLNREGLKYPNKVRVICEEFRKCLTARNVENCYLLAIMTTYVKTDQLDEVLALIQDLMSEVKPVQPPHIRTKSTKIYAQDALKYVCWLVDADVLFDRALALYDFSLVMMVAKYTQKDPKEYMPYLEGLMTMDEVMMRFQVNYDLKRYEEALSQLASGGAEHFEKALEVMVKHELYTVALELYKGSEQLPRVQTAFAAFLEEKQFYLQSGCLYKAVGDAKKALQQFSRCGAWQLALDLASDEKELRELANTLRDSGCHYGAAIVMQRYPAAKNDVIATFLRGGHVDEALVIAEGDNALIVNYLHDRANEVMNEIESTINNYYEKTTRLGTVQRTKRAMPVLTTGDQDDETASIYSVSAMSSATAISKRKKRQQRKLRKSAAKQGSQLEEDYLVDCIVSFRPDAEFAKRVDEIKRGLVLIGDFEFSRKITERFAELVRVTSPPLRTMRQQEFLNEFWDKFPGLPQDEWAEALLCDIVGKAEFLPEGMSSHVPIKLESDESFYN